MGAAVGAIMARAMSDHMPNRTRNRASPDDGPAKQIASKAEGSTPLPGTSGNTGTSNAIPGPSSETGARPAKSALIAKRAAQLAKTTAKKPIQFAALPRSESEVPKCILCSKAYETAPPHYRIEL